MAGSKGQTNFGKLSEVGKPRSTEVCPGEAQGSRNRASSSNHRKGLAELVSDSISKVTGPAAILRAGGYDG